MRKLAPLMIVVVLALACVASANLLVNASFENAAGGTGMQGSTPSNWWGYQHGSSEGWAGRTGTNGIAFWSWDNGEYAGFGQDVVSNIVLGDVISFSIWGKAEPQFQSSANEMWLQLEIWTNNGAAAYTIKVTNSIYSALIGSPNTWNQYRIGFTNNIAGLTLIKPIVGGGGFTNMGGSQAVMWDDADMTIAIPEPTMAALLGFSGLIFLAARRMARK